MGKVEEEELTGGNITADVVRLGDTVHRSRGSHSVFAAQVLTHLESAGFPYAPRHLGIDDRGRDVLSFVPGRTTDHPSQRAAEAYALGGRMLRALHDVTAHHPLAKGKDCVVHGDPGPYNTVFRDGLPVALIDWDSCRPGQRIDDLGFMAWTWCIQSTGDVPVGDQAHRLREMSLGYGGFQPDRLLDSVIRQQSSVVEAERANIGDPRIAPRRRRHARRAVTWATNDRTFVQQHRQVFLSTLSDANEGA